MKWSQATLITGQALDVASSWRQREANPLMRSADGRFGAKGLVIKAGFVVGLIAFEEWAVRRWPETAKVFRWVNFGAGGLGAGVAVCNWRTE